MSETNAEQSRPVRRWIHGVAMVISAFLLVIVVEDIMAVLYNDASYPFGWDGGGWRYSSKSVYLALSIFEVSLCSSIIITFLIKTRERITKFPLLIWALYYLSLLVYVTFW